MKKTKKIILMALALLLVPPVSAGDYQLAKKTKEEAEIALYNGRLDVAQQLFLDAFDLFSQCGDAVDEQSLCLYYMTISHFNQRDLDNMKKVLDNMAVFAGRHPNNKFVQYDYLSVLASYESAMYEESPSDSLREEFMTHFKKSLAFQEQMTVEEITNKQINPIFNYMNVATLYDLCYDPPLTDSMQKYIDKATDIDRLGWGFEEDHVEGRVSTYDLQAWIYLYEGEFKKAEAKELEVLELIESIEDARGNNLITERSEAYDFFVELYKTTGDFEKALEYQELKNENDRERFNIEKKRAIHDVETRYETGAKDLRIRNLRHTNIMLSAVVALLAILSAGTMVFVFTRRKLKEQTSYTDALVAESTENAKHTSLQLLADQLNIDNVDLTQLDELMKKATKPLTVVDKKYMICFLAGEKVQQIADRFIVEPASVYTVRYRLKKKFPKDEPLPF